MKFKYPSECKKSDKEANFFKDMQMKEKKKFFYEKEWNLKRSEFMNDANQSIAVKFDGSWSWS